MSVLDKLARQARANASPLSVDVEDETAFCVLADKAQAPEVASFTVSPSVSSSRVEGSPLGYFNNAPVFRAADAEAIRKLRAAAEAKAAEPAAEDKPPKASKTPKV